MLGVGTEIGIGTRMRIGRGREIGRRGRVLRSGGIESGREEARGSTGRGDPGVRGREPHLDGEATARGSRRGIAGGTETPEDNLLMLLPFGIMYNCFHDSHTQSESVSTPVQDLRQN